MNYGTLLIRLSVALSLLFFGIQKLFNYTGFVDSTASSYASTFVPMFLIYAFLYILPFLEAGIGAWLVSGQYMKTALIAAAVLMLFIQFGNLLGGEPSTVAENVLYIAAIALALYHE